MPTTMKPPIQAGKSYKVRFSNDVSSTGVVLVIVGWVPNHQNPVPRPEHLTVAPGGTAELTGTVPSAVSASRMAVIVDLDHGETGQLEVLEDGQPHSRGATTVTTMWGMAVL